METRQPRSAEALRRWQSSADNKHTDRLFQCCEVNSESHVPVDSPASARVLSTNLRLRGLGPEPRGATSTGYFANTDC